MKADGKWAWWNQYSPLPVEVCIDRAKSSGIQGVIVKADYPTVAQQFLDAGLRVAAENYVYPSNPEQEGRNLANAIAGGCEFAVINAEVEWELEGSLSMEELIATFRDIQPDTELYASTDTRGTRTSLPYQQVLARHIIGWMPMIYPLAFRPTAPSGFVSAAFGDCLDSGQSGWFSGKPVFPTIQTYNNIGSAAVEEELAQVKARGFRGYQAYTIGHATNPEWSVIVDDSAPEDSMEWLDEKILDSLGRPKVFQRLHGPDLDVIETTMTRKEWITFKALGYIVGEHSHRIDMTFN